MKRFARCLVATLLIAGSSARVAQAKSEPTVVRATAREIVTIQTAQTFQFSGPPWFVRFNDNNEFAPHPAQLARKRIQGNTTFYEWQGLPTKAGALTVVLEKIQDSSDRIRLRVSASLQPRGRLRLDAVRVVTGVEPRAPGTPETQALFEPLFHQGRQTYDFYHEPSSQAVAYEAIAGGVGVWRSLYAAIFNQSPRPGQPIAAREGLYFAVEDEGASERLVALYVRRGGGTFRIGIGGTWVPDGQSDQTPWLSVQRYIYAADADAAYAATKLYRNRVVELRIGALVPHVAQNTRIPEAMKGLFGVIFFNADEAYDVPHGAMLVDYYRELFGGRVFFVFYGHPARAPVFPPAPEGNAVRGRGLTELLRQMHQRSGVAALAYQNWNVSPDTRSGIRIPEDVARDQRGNLRWLIEPVSYAIRLDSPGMTILRRLLGTQVNWHQEESDPLAVATTSGDLAASFDVQGFDALNAASHEHQGPGGSATATLRAMKEVLQAFFDNNPRHFGAASEVLPDGEFLQWIAMSGSADGDACAKTLGGHENRPVTDLLYSDRSVRVLVAGTLAVDVTRGVLHQIIDSLLAHAKTILIPEIQDLPERPGPTLENPRFAPVKLLIQRLAGIPELFQRVHGEKLPDLAEVDTPSVSREALGYSAATCWSERLPVAIHGVYRTRESDGGESYDILISNWNDSSFPLLVSVPEADRLILSQSRVRFSGVFDPARYRSYGFDIPTNGTYGLFERDAETQTWILKTVVSGPVAIDTDVGDLSLKWFAISPLGRRAPPPTVSFTAMPSSVRAGEDSRLVWRSTNAATCEASGGWSGPKSTSGSEFVSPWGDATYTLTCMGVGTTTQTRTVKVIPPVLHIPQTVGLGSVVRIVVSSVPGLRYTLALSTSARYGFWLTPKLRVPLDPDALLFASLNPRRHGLRFENAQGLVGPDGTAVTSLVIPAYPALAGQRFYVAALVSETNPDRRGGRHRGVSDAVEVTMASPPPARSPALHTRRRSPRSARNIPQRGVATLLTTQ